MPVHWITDDLNRTYAVLSCESISESHMFSVLAEHIQDIHKTFEIEKRFHSNSLFLITVLLSFICLKRIPFEAE